MLNLPYMEFTGGGVVGCPAGWGTAAWHTPQRAVEGWAMVSEGTPPAPKSQEFVSQISHITRLFLYSLQQQESFKL